MAILFDLVAE